MTIGVAAILIYPTFWGSARHPVPSDNMHKLKMHPLIEPGPIFPNVFWKHVLVSISSISSSVPNDILLLSDSSGFC